MEQQPSIPYIKTIKNFFKH